MNPVIGLRLVMGVAVALALVFVWSNFVDWIQAPVVAKLETKEKQLAEQTARADQAEKAREELNRKLVEREARETAIDKRLEGLSRELRNLKSPRAVAQRDTVLDPELVRATQYKPGAVQVPSGSGTDPAGAAPTGPAGGRHDGLMPDAEKPAVRGPGEVQRPAARDRDPTIWQKMKEALK